MARQLFWICFGHGNHLTSSDFFAAAVLAFQEQILSCVCNRAVSTKFAVRSSQHLLPLQSQIPQGSINDDQSSPPLHPTPQRPFHLGPALITLCDFRDNLLKTIADTDYLFLLFHSFEILSSCVVLVIVLKMIPTGLPENSICMLTYSSHSCCAFTAFMPVAPDATHFLSSLCQHTSQVMSIYSSVLLITGTAFSNCFCILQFAYPCSFLCCNRLQIHIESLLCPALPSTYFRLSR